MRTFTQEDGRMVVRSGVPMVKLPNKVYLLQQHEAFAVETTEGVMTGGSGDYLAHDPISGHVWPVKASYVEQHYRPAEWKE